MSALIQISIQNKIFLIRGLRVMIDRDLAILYRVTTKALNQAVTRSRERFPTGFVFRLTKQEALQLITTYDRFSALKHATVTPLAFTEFGVAMLSSVLKSRRAIHINIQIIQTFIRLRRLAITPQELAWKVHELERKIKSHDRKIQTVFDAIKNMIGLPDNHLQVIGFKP